jgi:hypothetical protein
MKLYPVKHEACGQVLLEQVVEDFCQFTEGKKV